MFRLLQRMDDTEPRLPAGREPMPAPKRRTLPSLTLLADADESELQALEDWSRGLDWVQWLLSGVRRRLDHLHFQPSAAGSMVKTKAAWDVFASQPLQEVLTPHLMRAWQAVSHNDLEALLHVDGTLGGRLARFEAGASGEAGRLLFKATRQARYQGILGHYRQACESGRSPGHFLTVWAAVAHFFQLSLTNVVSEYLRLEWSLATRSQVGAALPGDFARLVADLLKPQVTEIRIVA
jgi:hypothetical protein